MLFIQPLFNLKSQKKSPYLQWWRVAEKIHFVFAIDSDSALKKFLDETADMTAEDRAKQLEKSQVLHPIAIK